MSKSQEIRRYLNVIRRAASLIEGLLDEKEEGLLTELEQFEEKKPEPDLQPVTNQRAEVLWELMEMNWPEAVPQFLITEVTEQDQINRANSVLDMMVDRSLEDKVFLDFGCGEGWVTQEAMKRGVASAYGYDIVKCPDWAKRTANYTTDLKTVRERQYDVVMLYDVLDHCENPMQIMDSIKQMLKPDGVVIVRCHPWTCRHATHLFKQGINRAYWHLFLSYEEIRNQINQVPMFTRAEKKPLEAYRWWFNGFKIQKEKLVTLPVPDFFHSDRMLNLLAKQQQIVGDEMDGFMKSMTIQFADYVLSYA